MCFLIHIFEVTHWKLAFVLIYMFMPEHWIHIMNEEKIPQHLYNLLEDAYRTFYHIGFLEVSKSYGIIPNGLKIKKAAYIGNVSKKFFTSWKLELTKSEVQLMKVLILEHVWKLYTIE